MQRNETNAPRLADWDFLEVERKIESELSAPFPTVRGEVLIKRSSDLEISVTARWACGADEACPPDRIEGPIGSRIPHAELQLCDRYGSVVRLTGVSRLASHKISYGPRTQYECSTFADTATWILEHVERSGPGLIAESLIGVPGPPGRDLWPDSSRLILRTERRRTRRSGGTITAEHTDEEETCTEGRDHIAFSAAGIACRIGEVSVRRAHFSGFLEFDEVPEDSLRLRIRQCLSLILGRPLIRIHETEHRGGRIVEFRAFSPRGWLPLSQARAYPPAPLCDKGHHIERGCFQGLVDAFLKNWNDLNLGLYSWNLWNARACPPSLGCAFTHAAIEAIMKSYYKSQKESRRTTLIDRDRFREIKKKFLDALPREGEVEAKAVSVLKNKIDALNVCPQSLQLERFFEDLGLDVGDVELAAMRHRNAAAHGGESPDYRTAQGHFDALQVLAARVLLAATSARDFYWDYTLLGYPPRRLRVAAGTVDADPRAPQPL